MGEVLTEWGGRRCPPPGGFQWNWSQVGRFGIQRLLGSWQFAEIVPSCRTPASGWAFPGLARFRPHFSSLVFAILEVKDAHDLVHFAGDGRSLFFAELS